MAERHARGQEDLLPLCTIDDPEKGDHPINCVTWDMAKTYCQAQEKRLPTEAEWEFATRGPDGRVYPWGDEPPTAAHLNACGTECVAWGKQNKTTLEALYTEDDGYPTTAPVGKFRRVARASVPTTWSATFGNGPPIGTATTTPWTRKNPTGPGNR